MVQLALVGKDSHCRFLSFPDSLSTVLAIIAPMFYILENYVDKDKIGTELTVPASLLFGLNDRGVRGTMLQKATFLVQHLNKNSLNSSVFEPMCSGFSDSSSALRELTLKATLVLVPRLTAPNLEKLSRYLIRLQGDPEASIRTNTVIFISKLAPHLTDMARHKLLLPAFARAFKDPFTPCRLAALKSTLQAKEYFDPQGVAAKVLPVVTPQLLDSSADVRREAFHVVDDLLFVLRQESERMNSLPQAEEGDGTISATPAGVQRTSSAPTPASAPVPAQAPSSGGYLSGLSSWMSSSAKASDPVPPPQHQPQQRLQQAQPPRAPATAPATTTAVTNTMSAMNMGDDFGDDDGWGDDDDFLDTSSSGVKTNTASGSLFAAASNEDELFDSFDTKPARTASLSANKGKLSVPTAKKATPKPAVTKLEVNDDDDGWDDF